MLRPAQFALPWASLPRASLLAGGLAIKHHLARTAILPASRVASSRAIGSESSSGSSEPATQSVAPHRTTAQTGSQRLSIFDTFDLLDPEPSAGEGPVKPSSAAAAGAGRPQTPSGHSGSDIFDTSEFYDPEGPPEPPGVRRPGSSPLNAGRKSAPANSPADVRGVVKPAPKASLENASMLIPEGFATYSKKLRASTTGSWSEFAPQRDFHTIFSSDEPRIKVEVSRPKDGQELMFRFRPAPLRYGKGVPHTVPVRWLRDSDVSSQSIDPHTRQKVHSSGALDWAKGLRLGSAADPVRLLRPEDDDRVSEPALEIFWEPLSGKEQGSSIIPLSLVCETPSGPLARLGGQVLPWNRKIFFPLGAEEGNSKPTLPGAMWLTYDDFQSAEGLEFALHSLHKRGLVFLRDVPTEVTDDAGCELRKVATRIGGLRNTFYGQTWDVKALGTQGRNVAYTNVDLGLHMDLLYFENPPQIQLLHCLRNRVVSGGDSYFVDAFEAANRLRRHNRKAWELLTWAPVPYQYLNDAHHYEFSHPVIQLVPPSLGANQPSRALRHINWSPPFQAPLPARGAKPLLDAMAAFDAEVRRPHLEYKTRMNEGDLVIFDNRRILHARTAFVEPEAPPGAPSEPSRWLKGGYVDGDAVWDIFRVLVAASARSA